MEKITARIYDGDSYSEDSIRGAARVGTPAYGGGKLGTIVIGDLRPSEIPDAASEVAALYAGSYIEFRYSESDGQTTVRNPTGDSVKLDSDVFYFRVQKVGLKVRKKITFYAY